VGRAFSLVATPLATFLDLVASRKGTIVLISSEFARTAPADFPHYVAAKCAAEGFARAAAGAAPDARLLIVRPPRLLTDQTNTPTGRAGCLPVEQVAASVVARLCDLPNSPEPEILESFPDHVAPPAPC
jgi:NAD(P)-dependent dehydrogenase (short-subunit alcohol dehydrogenase family)